MLEWLLTEGKQLFTQVCAKGFLCWLNICVALFGAVFFRVCVCVWGGCQCSQKWGVIKLHHSGKIVLLAWWLKKGGRKKKQWRINREEVKENRRKVVAGSVTAGFTRIYSRCFLSSPPCSPPCTTSHLPNSYITASLSPACAVDGWTGCGSLHFLTTDLLSFWEQASSLMDRGRL